MDSVEMEPKEVGIEASLLMVMASKSNYTLYGSTINKKRLLPATAIILEDYKKYYDMYRDHENIDFSLFYTQFSQLWHLDYAQEKLEYYRDYVFPAIYNSNTQGLEKAILGVIKQSISDDIKRHLVSGDIKKIKQSIEYYENKESELLSSSSDDDLKTIDDVDFSKLDKSKGIPWALNALQSSLGGIIREQFIVIAADSNTGKGALCITQAAHTLRWAKKNNIKKPIIYFNSESSYDTVFARLCSCLFYEQLPDGKSEVILKMDKVKQNFNKLFGKEAFYAVQLINPTVEFVLAKLKKIDPLLVIIDMADSLAREESPGELKKLYDNLRLMALEYGPILATSQSGNTTWKDKETGEFHHRKWLSDKDMYGSKAGKQGAADTAISIGMDDVQKNIRYISVTKEKEGVGDVRFSCELVEKYSLYKELAW